MTESRGDALRRLRAAISRFAFKDYQWSADYHPDERFVSVSMVMWSIPDAYDTTSLLDLTMSFLAPWREAVAAEDDTLMRFLYEGVKEFVCHEAGEVALVDGKRAFDPHVLFADDAYDVYAPWQRATGQIPTIGPGSALVAGSETHPRHVS